MLIKKIPFFEAMHTFECGQCFRWNCDNDGVYVGISGDKLCRVKNNEIYCADEDAEFWRHYFDLDTDYNEIQRKLIENDASLKKCIDFGKGIRILKQDVWEAIVSFIISANNNIPRIKKIIETMCSMFGKRCMCEGNEYYTFPTAETLAALTKEDLAPLRVGYRDEYIINAAKKISSKEIDISSFSDMTDADVKKELLKIKGIGPKVADCIMLFSLGRYSVFPTDVWIKRVLSEVYGVKEKDIPCFIENKFKNLAGFAQQYLFYYYRNNYRKL